MVWTRTEEDWELACPTRSVTTHPIYRRWANVCCYTELVLTLSQSAIPGPFVIQLAKQRPTDAFGQKMGTDKDDVVVGDKHDH